MYHKASKWYELCPWVNHNGCMVYMGKGPCCGCTFAEETWMEFFPATEKTSEKPEANLSNTKYLIDIITPQQDSIKWV